MANTAGNNLVDVEVEFDYVAELADELTIQTGDVIKDVKRMSGGWWEGTFNGKRGLFPDNFVKVISKDGSKTKQLLVGSSTAKDSVQLRSSQKKHGTVAARKKCRVLYSYQPKHEDELELKVDDIVDFDSEVEDGWWKGTLRGQCGVFPSNFVELLRSSVSQTTTTPAPQNDVANEETTTISVADKNKKNEKLKAEKSSSSTSLVSGRISSLIQEAESKTKKKSSENLNLIRRESPVGSENVDKSKSEANAPKLPPKPGPPPVTSRKTQSVQTSDNDHQTNANVQTQLVKPYPSSRRHSSAVTTAASDFYYLDKSQIAEYIDKSGEAEHEDVLVKRGSRLSQFFGRFGRGSESPRSSWTSSLFKMRKKSTYSRSKTSFSKIDEELSENAVAIERRTPASTPKKFVRRSKSKSEHDLGYEGIGEICPMSGIRTIERGSQTDIKSPKPGGFWNSRKFRRAKTNSTQTLPAELQDEDDDDDGGFGFPSLCSVSVHEIYPNLGASPSRCFTDRFYKDTLSQGQLGQICHSTPVLVKSAEYLDDGEIPTRKRNRIITNPRLFVQARANSINNGNCGL